MSLKVSEGLIKVSYILPQDPNMSNTGYKTDDKSTASKSTSSDDKSIASKSTSSDDKSTASKRTSSDDRNILFYKRAHLLKVLPSL